MSNDNLGDRMKGYENAYRVYLPRRLPLIVRLDMRAGHTYTKKFARPFDTIFHNAMVKTAQALCKEIEGCKLAYTQSDEISLLITNDDTFETQPWFNNNLQKIVSLSAAFASITFQHEMLNLAVMADNEENSSYYHDTQVSHLNSVMFDSRAFILPKEEVINYFYWRELDCRRNSVQMAAHAFYSQKQCQNKNNDELKKMLEEKNIYWDNYEDWAKYGTYLNKVKRLVDQKI